ncbi:riboflavin kinase / FAD synthase family protein, putative [Plasmodium gallinaceum]|uniref:riboflavin kinase n=1 Tax=Plasmodium gallinaceum TaxID=5849 RepID=A0A1J1GNQ1_PLAGA|nr:riboflavin kinase / FAD synthase family protein, putative [Plasmodium gallinaceum]CRG93948.1 riboflavin kinase / FAD synthase family protein, putative [Plasmodium gallinaceum]
MDTKKFKNIAFIDADYYIINYSSTITTYIQNIFTNLLRDKNTIETGNQIDKNIDERKKIICIFMLKIFLNNIDKNLNLFDYLHSVIKKYYDLIFNKKLNYKTNKIKVNDENENYIGKNGDRKVSNINEQKEKKNCEITNSLNEEIDKNEYNEIFINNEINDLMQNLIKNNNYNNMENINQSKICFINITNRDTKKNSSSVENFTLDNYCESDLSNNSKNKKTDYYENKCSYDNEKKVKDDSFYSTYKLNNTFPNVNKKRFLINYNNINLKLKNFDDFLNLRCIKKVHKEDEECIQEIKNLYRIIILSKLHIGVYNFLSFLKKKKYFFIFYTSNKYLTNLLFKWFKISRKFKNCYKVIDSFQELNLKNYNNFLVFSNRECFINQAKKSGFFKIAVGKNSLKTSNCDDVNWNIIHKENFISDYSDSISNKYNDVVYPFLRNCNLTEDILSWRIFYIFKKYIYIYGEVVKGFGRGSKYLNLPTANISSSNLAYVDIMPGIYFGISKLKNKIYKTVISIGYNPYFKNKHMTIEAFLYYKTNVFFYKENIHLIIMGILRSESNFSYFSHLIHAIQFDCELARIILNKIQNDKNFIKCKNYLNSL